MNIRILTLDPTTWLSQVLIVLAATPSVVWSNPTRPLTHLNQCETALSLRRQISTSAAKYELESRYGSRSTLNGTEFEVTGPIVGSHLVSLGTEADIFQPLHSFPLIENIHMIDFFIGLTREDGPAGIVAEIVSRLKAISPTAVVEIEDSGFLQDLDQYREPTSKIDISRFIDTPGKHTLKISVRWLDQKMNWVRRTVFLHPMDYESGRGDVRRLIKEVGQVDVLLVSGARLPSVETLYLYLDAMPVGGWLISDQYSVAGEPPDGSWMRAFEGKFSFSKAPVDPKEQKALMIHKIFSETWVGRKFAN